MVDKRIRILTPEQAETKLDDYIKKANLFLNVRDYGAVGDGVADDTAAILAAITDAKVKGRAVVFPAGIYGIASTIDFGGLYIMGEGGDITGGSNKGTVLRARTSGMTMVKVGDQGRVSSLGLEGADLAKIGMLLIDGPRQYIEHVVAVRCSKSGFVLAKTQNAVFVKCDAQYCGTSWTFANGARNNSFYGCDTGNFQEWYTNTTVPWSASRCLYFVIDESDPDYGGSAFISDMNVVLEGNDRNSFFGGIHEGAPTAIVVENRSNYSASGEAGNNHFYGTEFTCTTILNTSGARGYPNSPRLGEFLFDSCAFLLSSPNSNWGVGTAGVVRFEGTPNFNGGENNRRGITQPNNYSSLFVIDTDRRENFMGGDTYSVDASRNITVMNNPNNAYGFLIGPFGRAIGASDCPVGVTVTITFTVKSITGSNPVLVYLGQDGTGGNWRRLIASITTPGTYSYLTRLESHDLFQIHVGANGNTSTVLAGLSMKSAGA